MHSQYETSDTNNTQDLFDIGTDFSDALDNTQISSQQVSTSSTVSSSASPILIQQSTNNYQQLQAQTHQQIQTQPRLTYLPANTRAQLASYQTPNLQRIQTMPSTSTIVRPANVISNGIQQQQQATIYTQSQQQQQMINPSGGPNRPLYQRMPTATQQPTLIRQQYNSTGMINMNQNVPQMSIVKVRPTRDDERIRSTSSFPIIIQASDPNNNNVFVTNSQQQQQQPTLLGLQQTVTSTPTVQTNKPISTLQPSLSSQQLNQFQVHMQQQNNAQPYNTTTMRVRTHSSNFPIQSFNIRF